ncbi:MAG: cation-transporting P-type ATPase [Planctomycetes bacterium]|nr:cation-transporting P-type ATPase [Planctomycetota bacterium]
MQGVDLPLERLPELGGADRGLSATQVAAQRRYGCNDIVPPAPNQWRDILRDTARDPMLWFLIATAVLFAAIGDVAEALTLAVAVIPLLGMDAYLHRRTRASTAGLAARLASTAHVLRDGQWVDIPARELVPADLVEVATGEYFPADGVLVAGDGLQCDESTLTGEALPVRKSACRTGGERPGQVPQQCWAAAGTRLLTGPARLRVVHTGKDTRYGAIVRSAIQGSQGRTPLQAAIGRLVSLLLMAALLLCLALACIRLWQGHDWIDAALSAVTLAIAALPEEFPVVYTFFLGLGVYRLARRKALVRRAVAVENIGRVTCICSDKTGTITAGDLVLAHRLPASGRDAGSLLRVAAGAARADSGDPLDAALLAAAPAADRAHERIAVFPFTEQRRRESAVWRVEADGLVAVVKGAPETVIAMTDLTPAAIALWLQRVEELAATGHRVIACAARSGLAQAWDGTEPGDGLEFVGLLAFEDPVREGVPAAIAECQAAGMRVVMVTGDHPATAAAVARDIGLGDQAGRLVVLQPGDDGGAAAGEGVQVVSRATPTQKLQLVRALQAQGEIVAVTGDGVNDVPALQTADVGIAMGQRGTRSAREVAPVVLLDDNLRTIVRAVAEGRQLFRNLQSSFAYLLMVHIPLVLSAAVVPLMGEPLLYLPVHIVWLELVIHPTALLAFQSLPDHARLEGVRHGARARFFSGPAWAVIALAGLCISTVVVWGYTHALGAGRDVEHARAMALASMIAASATITVTMTGRRSIPARAIALGALVSLGVLVQVPWLSGLLHLRPLHGADWGWALAGSALAGATARALLPWLRRSG